MDVMLALDRDDLKPYRYLAKRWGWSGGTTYRKLDALKAEAEAWRSFYQEDRDAEALKQAEAKVEQAEARNAGFVAEMAALGARLKQAEANLKQYRSDPDPIPQTDADARAPGEGKGPDLNTVLEYAKFTGVALEMAESFYWHYDAEKWTVNGRPLERWQSKLMQWKAGQHRFADKRTAAPVSLNGDLAPDDVARAVGAHPSMTEADFYRTGIDTKTGLPTLRIRPDAKARLAL